MTALTVGRDWTSPVPAEPVAVSLVSGLPEIAGLNARNPKKKAMPGPALPAWDKPVNNLHDHSSVARDKTSPAGLDEVHLIFNASENNAEERSPRESLKREDGPPEALHRVLPSSSPAVAYQGLPAGIPAARGPDHEQVKTPANGKDTEDVMAIRKAIEKALLYPLFAKKRGREGTVLTEFTVNVKGYPEDISIVRSSGHDILDTAAKESLIKAAPFSAGKGRYEIPITFRLKIK